YGNESVIQGETRLVRLLVDEFAAHPVPGGQIADCRRPRQRLNGQVLAVTLRQHRRHPNALIHLAPPEKKSGCHHPFPAASIQSSVTQFSATPDSAFFLSSRGSRLS